MASGTYEVLLYCGLTLLYGEDFSATATLQYTFTKARAGARAERRRPTGKRITHWNHMTTFFSVQSWSGRGLLIAAMLVMCACGRAAGAQDGITGLQASKEVVSLTIVGYNYTDHDIDSFSVNDNGGGNVMASTPTSGGGGSVCCAPYARGSKSNTVRVRWHTDGCTYHVRSATSNRLYDQVHMFFKERDVQVVNDSKQPPTTMEVHFYPDGSVQVALTESPSLPRLSLPAERRVLSDYPVCPNDNKPTLLNAG